MIGRRRVLTLAAGAPLVLAAPGIVRSAGRTSIRIAAGVTPPSMHTIAFHVALERGFFARNGIDVSDFVQLRGGPLAIQALAAGQVDLAPADPEGLLAAVVAGFKLRAIAAPGSRLSYMVAVRKEISSIAALRGQRFAISRPGAISQYLLFPLLDEAGIPRDSVEWVAVGGARDRLLALQADRVQGALLHIDFAIEAGRDASLRLIKSVADVLPNYPVELSIMRKDMLDADPVAAAAIVRAIIEACRYIVRDKAGTIEVVLKYAPGTDREVLALAYDELIRIGGFGVDDGMTKANLEVAYDLALQNRQIDRPVALDQWVDFRFQDEAVRSLGRFAR
jgi:NitT/TauT family transport system substrate-binding protein